MEEKTFYGFREKGKAMFQSFALELVPAWRCELSCKNCYKNDHVRRYKHFGFQEMSKGFVINALDQATECGFSEAVFIGGEPTSHTDLPLFVKYSLDIGLSPIVVTNGIKLAKPRYAKELTLPGTTLVLHAPLPAQIQDEEVGVIGYNEKLRQAFENILGAENVTVVAEIVAIKEFLPHIPAMHQWCLENGVIPFIEFNRLFDDGTPYSGTASPEQVKNLFEQIKDADPNPPSVLLPPAYGQPCTMAMTGIHIKYLNDDDYSGVYSCCAQSVRHGDLLKQSLSEILDDPSLIVFKNQDEWIYGPCQKCKHYDICKGGCRGQAYQAFGCARASNPFCWNLSEKIRSNPQIMMPPTCFGCPLENNPACHPQR